MDDGSLTLVPIEFSMVQITFMLPAQGIITKYKVTDSESTFD